ncbi:hypothetical protein BX661DRAFT_172321 [Kickxella alabastrina]|uniref:uncharacterized protein n=1 Tax=Kickxella alabastrina TaxID=61397 RepID=UPI0022201C1B|nr:uncharacterized protein BX661DRAFT_172321 [Kickxella alabastrina]KAI7824497.1 hypothetical protein BX661DRAFT_172321 [Kickxella alabastrina]
MNPGIKVELWSYMPRPFSDNNVEVKIEYTGICSSDLHAIKDERSETMYPATASHAIAGKVITKESKGASKSDCVGIIGIGGLGHLTIQYAHTLGAETVGILHLTNKRKECLKLGVSIFVNTANREKVKAMSNTLNYLFVTSNLHTSQYGKLYSWMDFGGQIVLLGLPVGQLSVSVFFY